MDLDSEVNEGHAEMHLTFPGEHQHVTDFQYGTRYSDLYEGAMNVGSTFLHLAR